MISLLHTANRFLLGGEKAVIQRGLWVDSKSAPLAQGDKTLGRIATLWNYQARGIPLGEIRTDTTHVLASIRRARPLDQLRARSEIFSQDFSRMGFSQISSKPWCTHWSRHEYVGRKGEHLQLCWQKPTVCKGNKNRVERESWYLAQRWPGAPSFAEQSLSSWVAWLSCSRLVNIFLRNSSTYTSPRQSIPTP